jgi:hypothetical protein
MKPVSFFSESEWDEMMREVGEIRNQLTKQLANTKGTERKEIKLKLKSLPTKPDTSGGIVENCPYWILHRPILPTPEELRK